MFFDQFVEIWRQIPPAEQCLVAYSGGLDSHVLLHLCVHLRKIGLIDKLSAIHIHHGLMPDSDAWSNHCETVTKGLAVPFQLSEVNVGAKPGQSIEEAARDARYGALRQTMTSGCHLLTGQHQDDQAETMLLQLFRGTGLAGLSAMPEIKAFGKGRLVRPLLSFTREILYEYAVTNKLIWINDGSNDDRRYGRNYLRHEIMPLLKERWPGISHVLTRTSRHCAEANDILAGLASRELDSAQGKAPNSLSISALAKLVVPYQRLVIRKWITDSSFRCPAARIIDRILKDVLTALPDRMPIVCWKEGAVRRYRDDLFILPPPSKFEPSAVLSWYGSTPLQLPDDNGKLEILLETGEGIPLQLWEKGRITVRYRRGGERCKIPNRIGHHSLKKLFQEKGVPPWERQQIPLIYIDDVLAAVGNDWICEPFSNQCGGENIRIVWKR
ncbi:MAG: tRNA lysidine(34) synthetase TilS [Methylococcales bacterium]